VCDQISDKQVKIRKPRRCWGCTKQYAVGTSMLRVVSKDAGEIGTAYWCDECNKALAADPNLASEECFMYGALAE
jgi:hypothetical protein